MRKQSYGSISYQTDEQTLQSLDLWTKVLGVEKKEEVDMKQMVVGNNHTPQEDFDPFLDQEEQDGFYEVDKSTGEVLPVLSTQDEITIYQNENIPEYLIEYAKLTLPLEEKSALLSIYESHVEAKPFKSLINKEIKIYGGIIWEHPAYRAKGTLEDAPMTPGYHQILLLSLDNNDEPYIIEASYGALAVHVRALLSANGWFLWEAPITYMFAQDSKTNAFQMYNRSRVKSLIASKVKK